MSQFTQKIMNFTRLIGKKHYSDVFVVGGYKWWAIGFFTYQTSCSCMMFLGCFYLCNFRVFDADMFLSSTRGIMWSTYWYTWMLPTWPICSNFAWARKVPNMTLFMGYIVCSGCSKWGYCAIKSSSRAKWAAVRKSEVDLPAPASRDELGSNVQFSGCCIYILKFRFLCIVYWMYARPLSPECITMMNHGDCQFRPFFASNVPAYSFHHIACGSRVPFCCSWVW
jgi:hypothetical protein